MRYKQISKKLLVIGIVLSLMSLGIGQALKYDAVKNMPQKKFKDCSSIFMGTIEERRALINTVEMLGIIMAESDCDSYNEELREESNRIEEASVVVATIILGVGISPWVLIIVLPMMWKFLLHRIRELSKAITNS